ncbi:hypothetical protein F4678DRAFT_465548 [Xylaria arbuscula]|nr:hypothetical protein F4678DRAFT_465548 [Xylaria arbuscula]
MNRRSHKKSRLGCQECKRRHIKCNEKRPTCAHCTITQRTCRYVVGVSGGGGASSTGVEGGASTTAANASASATSPGNASSRADDAPSPSPGLSFHSNSNSNSTPAAAQPTTVVSLHDDTHGAAAALSMASPASGSVMGMNNVVNMNHMEFLLHYTSSIAIPELDAPIDPIATNLMTKLGLEFPWLLHAMLAISARHLAFAAKNERADRAKMYLAEAVQLQTQAINRFNAERLVISEGNCAAALLFSSILGRHMLVHRGLRAIASDSWQMLPETELWPLALFTGIQNPRKPCGRELEGLSAWIEGSSKASKASLYENQDEYELGEEEVKVCLAAVELLQVGLDKVTATATSTAAPKPRARVHQMAFIWSVCVDAKFIDLVLRRVPQALVILAHYAALLHHSRELWQIGDAGYRFLHTICSVLGPSYEEQLEWVRGLVFGGEG